jgi:hypothetical protein
MVCSFYDDETVIFEDKSLNEKWSPAEVNQILFRNFKSITSALIELHELTPNDLYGFSTK